jgi:hypothetical protein
VGVDSYFVIGAAHTAAGEPCQDYALHGPDYGVIADGCSSSRGRPDVGARLAAVALARAISAPVSDPACVTKRLLDGLAAALATGLAAREDLLTTTGGFRVDEDGIQAWLWGDGVIYVEYADGSTEMRVVEWADNTPFYPVYLLDPDPPALSATVNGIPAADSMPYYCDLRNPDAPPVRNVIIATDGIRQIAGLSVADAIAQFTAFKTVEGAFLKRRMMRALKTFAPVDDLGIAAYHETVR